VFPAGYAIGRESGSTGHQLSSVSWGTCFGPYLRESYPIATRQDTGTYQPCLTAADLLNIAAIGHRRNKPANTGRAWPETAPGREQPGAARAGSDTRPAPKQESLPFKEALGTIIGKPGIRGKMNAIPR
jgi:hypothetical protein